MTPILSAKKIKKIFEIPVELEILSGIDLELYPGESVAITGKSGEGKSTLLHILGTLENATEGSLQICSIDANCASSINVIRNQHVGFIFQNFNLLGEYSVLENALMPAKIGRNSIGKKSPIYRRMLELLDEVGLSDRLHFPVKLLSGGEKQRVALARALCNDPALILADEPSGNLDQTHSQAIHELLIYLTQKKNKGLIVVTHDEELASLCNRKALLTNGTLSWIS